MPKEEQEIAAASRNSDAMPHPLLVFYYQLTLGPAHMARIRALDEQPGVLCRGVELASRERTRRYQLSADEQSTVHTLTEGVYEDLPFHRRLRAALRQFRIERPDVLILDSPADPVQFLLGRIAQISGARVFTRWAATLTDHPRFGWKEFLKRGIYKGWDHYLVTGQRGLEYLNTFDVPAASVSVCGNPVDAGPIEVAHRERSSESRIKAFLFVGRFLKLKNLESFIEAFLRYREEGGSWRLKLAGNGESEKALRARVKSETSVEFLGHLGFEELIQAYLAEGCLVLPSYSENWGLVVNEAMHAGMPILISELCGCRPELLEAGANGFSIDPFSVESMVAGLHQIESLDSETRRAFSHRSTEIISSHDADSWARKVGNAVRDHSPATTEPPSSSAFTSSH